MSVAYVVSSGNSDTVLERMPAHMQYLLVEVDLIRIRLLAHSCSLPSSWRPGSTGTLPGAIGTRAVDRRRHTNLLRLEGALVCLQHNLSFLLRIGWIDHEVVVVGARHDIGAITTENDLEFVKDAVILVGIAEAGSEVFVDGNCLDWLPLHIHIPDLDCEVVA